MIEAGILPPASPTPSTAAADGTISLMELAGDMDAEARAYEIAVFDSFYYTSMARAYSGAVGGAEGVREYEREEGEGHGGSGAESDLPRELTVPLPSFATPKARAALPMFKAYLARLKEVGVEGGAYGQLDATLEALDALGDYADSMGIRAGARAWLLDQDTAKATAEALVLAGRLVQPR